MAWQATASHTPPKEIMFFDFLSVKKSIEKLETKLADLRNQSIHLQKQSELIRYAPASKGDVKAMAKKWITEAGLMHTKTLQESAVKFSKSPNHPQAGRFQALATLSALPVTLDEYSSQREIGGILCVLLAPMLAESLDKTIDAMDWPENALPMEGREQKIETISKQIAAVNAEIDQIMIQAHEAGIKLE